MDLVLLVDPSLPFPKPPPVARPKPGEKPRKPRGLDVMPDFYEQTSIASHRSNIAGIDDVYAVLVTYTTDVAFGADIAVHNETISDPFLLSTSSSFISSPFDLNEAYCREKFAPRKGDDTERMTRTLSYLLEHGHPTKDFEMNVPIVVYKDLARSVLDLGRDKHFRTMYGNIAHQNPKRIPDPNIELWVHSLEPSGPVVSMSRTALKHLRCLAWLKKLREQCLSGDQTVLVP